MKILVACEFSGRVRDAFAAKGHDVTSCDILPSESPNGKHYQGDIKDILYQDWDMILAFPPCTYLTLSGVRWLSTQEGRWQKMLEGVEFFNLFLSVDCPRVCIENPVMHGYAKERLLKKNYDQKIQPYFFGHAEKKTTCLWLKGLPKLKVTNDVGAELRRMHPGDYGRVHWEPPGKNRQKNRSRTYLGVAQAMADQWG